MTKKVTFEIVNQDGTQARNYTVSTEHAERLVTELQQKIKESKIPVLPEADVYKCWGFNGKAVYFAKNRLGNYMSAWTAEQAINTANDPSNTGLPVSYFIDNFGPLIYAINLKTTVEVVSEIINFDN